MKKNAINSVEAELREIEEEFASGRMNAFGTAATKESFVRELRKIADIETQIFYKTCGLLSASIAEDHLIRAMMFATVDSSGMAGSSPNNTDDCSTTMGTNISLGQEACNNNNNNNNNSNNKSSGSNNNLNSNMNTMSGNNNNKDSPIITTSKNNIKGKHGCNEKSISGEIGSSAYLCGGGGFGTNSSTEGHDCAAGQTQTATAATPNMPEAANGNDTDLPPWGNDVGLSDRPFLDISRHFKMLEGEFAVIGEHLRHVSRYVLRLNDIVEKVRSRGTNAD